MRGQAVRRKNANVKKSEALDAFEALEESFPEGVVSGQEELRESNEHYLHTYICRTGTIAEHIDLDAVFDFYCKLGICAPGDEVRRLCDVEIMQYGTPNAPSSTSIAELQPN